MPYALGAVKPWVRSAAEEVGPKFGITTIYGIGARANVSDHPKGLATDFMVYKDRAKGDAVAAYMVANAARLNVNYVIWYQRIWQNGSWSNMENRGSDTANHKDHVHVSYNASGTYSAAGAVDPGGTGSESNNGAGGMAAFVSGVSSPGTWIRVLEFVAGVVIIGLIAYSLVGKIDIGKVINA